VARDDFPELGFHVHLRRAVETVLNNFLSTCRSSISVALFIVAIALSRANAVPQQASTATTAAVSPEEVKVLLQRLRDLEDQVAVLKTQVNRITEKPNPSEAASASPAPDTVSEPAAELGMSMPGHVGETENAPRLLLRGYGDIDWIASDLRRSKNSFALGQFTLFINSRLSDKASVLAETVIEADSITNEFSTDLERLELIYAVNDHLNLQFGRFHTALGYYNTAYHHSAFMQTALERPFLFAFEDTGGILPVHSVGISAIGAISSRHGLHYIAEIGNGRTSRAGVSQVQNVIDDNNGKAFNLGFFMRPDRLRGMQFGLSNYHDHVTPAGKANVTENILAAHVIYQSSRFEFLNEAALVRHTTADNVVTANTAGFYSQISRRFGNYRPYFRYEYVNVPVKDPLYSDVGLLHGPRAGLRYELNEFAAFKVEYGREMRRGLGPVNSLGTQLAFDF
jgi:hypothetical protein